MAVLDAERDPALRMCAAYRPFLSKPNHLELSAILGRGFLTDEEIFARAQRSCNSAAHATSWVSMAAKGAILLDESRGFLAPPRGTVKNRSAWDSMVAGFLAGWLEKRDYAHALKMGAATGSATAFRRPGHQKRGRSNL